VNIDVLLESPQFKQALFDVQTAESERFAANAVPVSVSPAFERKMERLLRTYRQPYYPLINTRPKRVLLSFAVVLLLLITMVFSVSALREPVVRFFVEVYEKFSDVILHKQQEEQFPVELEVYFEPTWLPEGYRFDADQSIDVVNLCERLFVNETDNDILFKQYVIISSALRIDTEGIQSSHVVVNENEGLYYSNKGIQNLVWSDGQYGFRIIGPVSEADLLRIAESIQPIK